MRLGVAVRYSLSTNLLQTRAGSPLNYSSRYAIVVINLTPSAGRQMNSIYEVDNVHKLSESFLFFIFTILRSDSFSEVVVDITDDTVWIIADIFIHHFDPDGRLLSLWPVSNYGSKWDTFYDGTIDYTRRQLLVTLDSRGTLLWLDLETGKETGRFNMPGLEGVSVTPDGSRVILTVGQTAESSQFAPPLVVLHMSQSHDSRHNDGPTREREGRLISTW